MNLERLKRIGTLAAFLTETEGYDEDQALEIACLDRSWPDTEEGTEQ